MNKILLPIYLEILQPILYINKLTLQTAKLNNIYKLSKAIIL